MYGGAGYKGVFNGNWATQGAALDALNANISASSVMC